MADLQLEDEDFWTDPFKEAPSAGFPKLPPKGLALAAPKVVAIHQRETLPVVVRRTATLYDAAHSPFARYGVVAAMDVVHNELYSGYAQSVDNPIWPEPPEGLTPDRAATVSEPYLVELREQVGVPWRHTEWLVNVILRDQLSNRVRVQAGAARGSYRDEEVEAFLRSKRGVVGPAPESPSALPFPQFLELPLSPPVPDEVGIALSIERVVVRREGTLAVLYGSFRLSVPPEDFVQPSTHYPQGMRRPTAIVAVHLLSTGSEDATPATATLRVPTFDAPPNPREPATLTGHFAVDLISLLGPPEIPQTLFVYAFSREAMAGPAKVALITEDMLPPGAV